MGGYLASVFVALMVLVVAVCGETGQGRPVSVVDSSNPAWNNVMDLVLTHAKEEMRKRGRDLIDLKDVHHRIDKKFAFLKLRGNFTAVGGWLSDVTTVRRVGDVETKRVGSALEMAATFTWDDLRLGYHHYRLDLGRVVEGDFEVAIKSNAVRVAFSFDLVDGECVTKLVNLNILEMGDLRVKVTGLGFLNFLAQHIINWFVESRRSDITANLEMIFTEGIPEHLEDFQCDEYASLLMVDL